jgi:hypothetical protein
MHKGAISDGIQSTSRIYYHQNTRDTALLAKEKKRILDEKTYLKGSHFKFSLQENKDQWKSANNLNSENQKINDGPGKEINLADVRDKMKSTNIPIDKKYGDYKGISSIS